MPLLTPAPTRVASDNEQPCRFWRPGQRPLHPPPPRAPKERVEADPRASTHLRHEPVGAGAFLVLEDDVGVVVGHEVVQARVVPGDGALRKARRAQRILGDVGHVLLEHERGQLARRPASAPAPTRPAALHTRGTQHRHDKDTCVHLLPAQMRGAPWPPRPPPQVTARSLTRPQHADGVALWLTPHWSGQVDW